MDRILFIILMISLYTSCQSPNHLPQAPKTLRLGLLEEPMDLDPRTAGDATSSQLQFLLFEGLTRLHPNAEVSPAQSHKIEVSKDQKRYTFYLGKTFWSDGTVVTAYDFEKAWKNILSPSFPAPNAHLLYPIQGALEAKRGDIPVEQVSIFAPNSETLVIELTTPTPYFLQLVSFCTFFPVKSGMDNTAATDPGKIKPLLITNGPFALAEWKRKDHMVLIKNQKFRDPQQVYLDQIHLQLIPSELTALQMYENGQLDFIGNPFCSLPAEEVSSSISRGDLYTSPTAATTFVSLNTDSSLFNNIHLRKAFAYAIDRQSIVEHISPSQTKIATGAVPPILKSYQKSVVYTDNNAPLAQTYLTKALKELNLEKQDLEKITFLYAKVEDHHKIAQAIQQQLLINLGIRIQLQSVDSKHLISRLSTRDYSLALTTWRAQFYDPISILERFKHKGNVKNYPGWESEPFKKMLEESVYHTGSKRQLLLDQAEALFLEEMPVIPICHWNLSFLKKDHLSNIEFSPVGGIFFERLKISEIKDPS
jgi:oligopeptide transport system substrate-binding protein